MCLELITVDGITNQEAIPLPPKKRIPKRISPLSEAIDCLALHLGVGPCGISPIHVVMLTRIGWY